MNKEKHSKFASEPAGIPAEYQPRTDQELKAFIDETELCRRLEISRGTAINHRRDGLLPFVRLGRAIRYHWPTVSAALLRQQQGGVE